MKQYFELITSPDSDDLVEKLNEFLKRESYRITIISTNYSTTVYKTSYDACKEYSVLIHYKTDN